jgi:hypothetical protein
MRSFRFRLTVTSRCSARKEGSSGATCWRPKPAGAEMSRWPLARALRSRHGVLGLFQLGQDALAVFQEGRALIGQRQFARGTLQQLDAQALFQRIEAAADHGRRNALGAGGSRQAALGNHIDKGRDLA